MRDFKEECGAGDADLIRELRHNHKHNGFLTYQADHAAIATVLRRLDELESVYNLTARSGPMIADAFKRAGLVLVYDRASDTLEFRKTTGEQIQ